MPPSAAAHQHPGRSFTDQDGNFHLNGGKIYVDGVQATAAGSALTLTVDEHSGETILLNTAAGSTVTLPAATGSGAIFRFRVSVLATTNAHVIQVASADDVMQGFVFIADTDSSGAASGFFAASDSDTITLDRSTTGSVTVGEFLELEDIAEGVWHVRGFLSGTGTVATPFSADVS